MRRPASLSPKYLGRIARFEVEQATIARRMDREAARLAGGTGPVVVGPWASEVGFELLYWIPFVRAWAKRHKVAPERLTVVSRGGAAPWYGDLAGRYVELLDLFSQAEIKAALESRVEEARTQKQLAPGVLEEELVRRAPELDGAAMLHPSVMYRRFAPFWAGRGSAPSVLEAMRYEPITAGGPKPDGLPDRYVAVKAYFTKPFPPTDEGREVLDGLLSRLAARHDVVLLSSGVDVDDHSDHTSNVVRGIEDLMTPQDNLAVQTRVIAGAEALVCVYGGFSYLGPLMGVPTVSLHSTDNFKMTHVDIAARMVADLRKRGHPASYVTLHTSDLPTVEALCAS